MYLYRKSSLILLLDYCKLTIPLNVYNYTLNTGATWFHSPADE